MIFHVVQIMTHMMPLSLLAVFWYQFTQVVLEKKLINKCFCCYFFDWVNMKHCLFLYVQSRLV